MKSVMLDQDKTSILKKALILLTEIASTTPGRDEILSLKVLGLVKAALEGRKEKEIVQEILCLIDSLRLGSNAEGVRQISRFGIVGCIVDLLYSDDIELYHDGLSLITQFNVVHVELFPSQE
jgi:hypothetical protein